MNCSDFKKQIKERVGGLFLEEDERDHLRDCPDCRRQYEYYLALEANLKKAEIEPLSATEFAIFQQKLDSRINNFQMRAISFYRLSTRYGGAFIAIAFIFFLSFMPRLEFEPQYTQQPVQTDSYYLADNGYDEDVAIDEQYLDLILYNYTQNHGFNSGESLLGELSSDELDYLEKNLDVGDIL